MMVKATRVIKEELKLDLEYEKGETTEDIPLEGRIQ